MKFTLTLILTCTIVLAGIVNAESAPFHIGVMTGTVSQSEDTINANEVGLAFAVATIYMVPCLLLFLHGEDYLVEGIAHQGSVKG